MSLRRRTRKLSKAQAAKITGTKWLMCSECGEEELEVNMDIGKVICAYCVQRMVAPPDNYVKKEKSDKPKGWHFKAYFEHEGKVYVRGVEIVEEDEIARLRKTHTSSKPKTVVKKTKSKKPRKANAKSSR
jgi:hypothetical protein